MSDLKNNFEANGFLVMKDFYTPEQCDSLIERANELSRQYEFNGAVSVFQTTEQTKTTDEYFLESGNTISFFFEKDAFDDKGNLKQSMEKSFNKIGHALHDLDDVFNKFSRSEKLKELSV
ncbi:MAG: phytanoyl-CoA dioxygenase family protein, partial [Bacteroidia bacterium]|nr:phytanoyl-CoA dioxygenase family protein [Bacteroidia bacterium]